MIGKLTTGRSMPPTAPMSSPRPMPRPDGAGMGAPPAGGFGGLFGGGQMTPETAQAVREIIAAAMSSASQADPLVAGLAPIAGALIGRNVQSRADAGVAARNAEVSRAVLGPVADDPAMKAVLDALQSPDTPDYLRAAARLRLDAAMKAARPGSAARTAASRAGSRSTRNTGALPRPARRPESVAAASQPALPPLPPDPVMPLDPARMTDDELLRALGA